MIIRSWDDKETIGHDSSFIVIDRHGNTWRLTDDNHDDWRFEIMFVKRINGSAGRVSVASVTGNVMDVGVA